MDANKLLSADLLDLLFEGRNKDYGAYDLRRNYNKRIRTAVLTTGVLTSLAIGGFIIAKANERTDPIMVLNKHELVLEKIDPEEQPVEIPPPPVENTPPPEVAHIDYATTRIVPDEEVDPNDVPPDMNDVLDAKIDLVNTEGIKDMGIATPSLVDDHKQIIEVKKDDPNKVYVSVEVDASFEGGANAWRRFLERNLRGDIPIDNGAPAGRYTVLVQFIVSKDGKISDVKALTHNGYGMEDEAMRVIKNGPDWKPALQNGVNVNAYRKQPITFIIGE